MSSIVTIQTGPPVTAVMSGNSSNTNNPLLGSLDLPNVVGNPNVGGAHTIQNYFNTAAFVAPATERLETRARTRSTVREWSSLTSPWRGISASPREKSLQMRLKRQYCESPEFRAAGQCGEQFHVRNHFSTLLTV